MSRIVARRSGHLREQIADGRDGFFELTAVETQDCAVFAFP